MEHSDIELKLSAVINDNAQLREEIARLKKIIEFRDEEIKLTCEINQHRRNIEAILNEGQNS
jgi:hypothetical protein